MSYAGQVQKYFCLFSDLRDVNQDFQENNTNLQTLFDVAQYGIDPSNLLQAPMCKGVGMSFLPIFLVYVQGTGQQRGWKALVMGSISLSCPLRPAQECEDM